MNIKLGSTAIDPTLSRKTNVKRNQSEFTFYAIRFYLSEIPNA